MTHYNVRLVVEEVTTPPPITIRDYTVMHNDERQREGIKIRNLIEFKTTQDTLAKAIKRATDVLALEDE